MSPARVFLLLTAIGGLGIAVACASKPDDQRFTAVLAPDYNLYKKYVDKYLDRRCGTLDCHGQAGRAFRMYGVFGLRIFKEDAALISGGQPTIEEETYQNYLSVIGLQPEEMSRVVANDPSSNPRKLLIIQKPLNVEGNGVNHKGGTVMSPFDPGERCLVGWLTTPVGAADLDTETAQACTNAGNVR